MKHILPRLLLLPVAAALVAVSCNKNVGEGTNVALKRQFDAWRDIHYPAAQEKDGIYIIEDIPGTGREWDEDLPVTFLTYTMRDLDGTVTYNTDERWAKQLGTWSRTGYYGPQVTLTGEDASYAGLDVLLDGMRQGGTRTAIIPSWMLTYKRYDSLEKYLEVSTDAASTIYTITFLDQTENLKEYEFRNLKDYAAETWHVTDTLSTGAVFFKSFTEFDERHHRVHQLHRPPPFRRTGVRHHDRGHRQGVPHLQSVQDLRPRFGHLGRESHGNQAERQLRGERIRLRPARDARRRKGFLLLRLQPGLRQFRIRQHDPGLRRAPVRHRVGP